MKSILPVFYALAVTLLTLFGSCGAAFGQSRSPELLSFPTQQPSLKEVIATLQRNKFAVTHSDSIPDRIIHLPAREITLSKLLTLIGEQAGVEARRINNNIYIRERENKIVPTPVKLSGKVTDAESGQPIGGVTIADHRKLLAITDADGIFSLTVMTGTQVYFSTVSHESYSVRAERNTESLFIQLQPASKVLDNVVVTALGIKRETKAIGYAAQKVDGKSLTDAPANNWLNTLSGKVPGMELLKSDGPVGSTSIILRGNKSLNLGNNNALIVIDGVIISNTVATNGGNNYLSNDSPVDFGSAVSDLNPDDIENITVLKGPGATALYGSRGAPGAIIITTKSGGKKNGLGVTVNSATTVDKVNHWPDYQNEYGQGGAGGATYYSYGTTEDGNGTQGTSQAWGPRLNTGVKYYQYDPVTHTTGKTRTPWIAYPNDHKDLFRTGLTLNNSLAMDGGNGTTSLVRLSVGNQYNQWILPNTGFNKTDVNLSIQQYITKNFKVNAKAIYTNKKSGNLPNLGYDNKTISYFLLDQAPNVDVNWYKDYWQKPQQQQRRPFSNLIENPYFALYEQLNPLNRNSVIGNTGFTYTISPELTLSAKTGIVMNQDISSSRQPMSSQRFTSGMYETQSVFWYEMNTDFLLTYNRRLGSDWHLNFSVGGNAMHYKYDRSQALITQLVIPGVYKMSNGVNPPVYTGTTNEKAINSLYGVADVSYRDWLYLDITGRSDWSSALPAQNNSYFYPSANLSWVITDFLHLRSNTLSYAKLRLSYAVVGNDGGTNNFGYNTARYYDATNGFSSSLTNPTIRPNYNLRPEMTHSYEAGVEAHFLKDRIGTDIAVYENDTYDQILNVPVDESSGYYTAQLNAGLVVNKGIEVQLWAKPVVTSRFTWTTTINGSGNRGKVVRLTDYVDAFQLASAAGGVALIARPGGSIGDIYGQSFVYAPDGQRVFDAQGVPVLSTDTRKVGNANPSYHIGWNNEFTYKNFTFGILFDGQKGGQKYSLLNSQLIGQGKLKSTLAGRDEGYIIGKGVIQNDDKTYRPNDVPIITPTYYTQMYLRQNAEANILDASYIKLRETRINYAIRSGWLQHKGIQGLTAGIYGRDLFVFSKWPIFDPESATLTNGLILPGIESGQLPSTRSVGVNVRVNF